MVCHCQEDIETQMEILHRDESQVKKRNSNTDDQASEDVDESQSPAEDDGKEEQDIQEEAEVSSLGAVLCLLGFPGDFILRQRGWGESVRPRAQKKIIGGKEKHGINEETGASSIGAV